MQSLGPSSIQRLVEKPAKETEQAWWVTRENPERVMSWKARGGNGQLSGCWEAKPEWEREQRPLELAAWRLATGFAACGTFSSLTRWSLNHWTAREVPDNMVFNDLKKKQVYWDTICMPQKLSNFKYTVQIFPIITEWSNHQHDLIFEPFHHTC